MLSFTSAPPPVPGIGRPRVMASGRARLGGLALPVPSPPSGKLRATAATAAAAAESASALVSATASAGTASPIPPSPADKLGLPLPPAAAAALAQSLPPPPPPLMLLVIADRGGSRAAAAVGAATAAAAADAGLSLTVTPVVAASRVPRPMRPFMYGYLKTLGVAAVVDTEGWTEAELGYTPGAVGLALVSCGRLAWQRKALEKGKGGGKFDMAVDEQVIEVLAAARGVAEYGG
ncbi:hypothetical protein MMPV_009537 [Pyropia vietnamensis]